MRQTTNKLPRHVSASSSSPEFSGNNNVDVIGDALSSVTSSLSEVVSDMPDVDEEAIATKKRLMEERTKTYSVTLPLVSSQLESKSSVLSIGMTLRQITKGRTLEDDVLNMDTLSTNSKTGQDSEKVQYMDEASLLRRVDGEFQGVVVASVLEGSSAWVAGVRAGDILKTTSATMGAKLWPKSTLEGVRSAVSSRKLTSGSIQFEFQRLGEAVDNQFELTLTRPIGLELRGRHSKLTSDCKKFVVLSL